MADTPLDAYWAFFTNFNTRDPVTFSSALNYPHVRLSPRRAPGVVPTLEDHAAAMSWDRFIADGWDHTVGVEPEVLQVGEDRAHIRGGWTRFTKDGDPILTNYVTYIATRLPSGWGIQSRFGIDGGVDSADDDILAAADAFVTTLSSGDSNAVAHAMHLPNVRVGVGVVDKFEDRSALVQSLDADPVPALDGVSRSIVYGGVDAATVVIAGECTAGRFQGLFFFSRVDDQWGVQARSTFIS